MSADLATAAWPVERLGEAIGLLAHRAGLIARPARFPATPRGLGGSRTDLRRWIASAGDALDVEAEPVSLSYEEAESKIAEIAPAVFRLPGDGPPRFLAVESCRRGRAVLLDPEAGRRAMPSRDVAAALRSSVDERHGAEIDRLLDEAGVGSRRRAVKSELMRRRLGQRPIAAAWLLRLPPSAPVAEQAREAGLTRLFALFLAVYVPKIAAWLGAWWFLWKGALEGRPDWGWLFGWVLVLFSNLPFRLLEPWYGALFSVHVGWIVKRRLLAGSMRLEPEEIRHQGTGQLLGRTMESEAAEELSLQSGMLLVSHAVDLLLVFPILAAGAGGWLHAVALLVWTAASVAVLGRYYRQRRRWTELRLDATHQLVEQMVGHRTRLAQEAAGDRHRADDAALEGYLHHSRRMDRTAAAVRAAVPGGWLVLSLLLLTPAVVQGGFSTASLALALGGTLFSVMAMDLLTIGLVGSADAVVAWEKAIDLFRAAARPKVRGVAELALGHRAADPALEETGAEELDGQPFVEGCDLVFGYRDRGEPVIKKCDLRIRHGDRVLLEGPSGGGKSTLLSLVLGLRNPDSGLLFLDGLDRPSLGDEGWRRRVAAAPQFHENHVFLGTFAFNLLLGREWPPEPEDFAEAEAVCRELGLGELLERMPGGLLQMVGETGWQLSHGERSRLYIARALLQRADLLAFDESFAALDPENLDRALKTVLDRASTVLVIAHP
jgi:ATP-binding cassette subfamily B protein